MAEHSEAPKNPQNPTEKSGSEYQPLWDMEQPAPDYSALLLHGTPVPAPTGEIPEPVREVLEIQKARSASVAADPVVPAVPALAVSAPAPSAQAANFFPSATGHPVLNRPLYGRPGPTMRRMSPMGTDTAASANQQAPSAFPAWLGEKVEGAPRPIGYIPAAPVAGKVSGSELRRKACPLSFYHRSFWCWRVCLVHLPDAYHSDFGASPVAVGWCADLYADPSEPKVPGAEMVVHAAWVVLVLPGV